MRQIAARIAAHLQRMERDPAINVEVQTSSMGAGRGLHRFYHAHAGYVGGRFIRVSYMSFQGVSQLTREEALIYLAALDAGSTDRHFEVLRKRERRRS